MVATMVTHSRPLLATLLLTWASLPGITTAASPEGTLRVQIDASACPEHAAWATSAQTLANDWYPRLGNLLASGTKVELPLVRIRIDPSYQGVAAASGTDIRLSAAWVKQNPDDARGVVIHELVHVVQAYPENREGWITEGIADYLRYGIFEAKSLQDFPRPDKPKAYQDGYQVAGGFMLWLESGPAPGVVRRLNSALRHGSYQPGTFEQITGAPAETLWKQYVDALRPAVPLPGDPQRLSYPGSPGGAFVRRPDGTWVEEQRGRVVCTFREVGRSPSAIEILDEGRAMRLRLAGREVQWRRDGQWVTLYPARWEASPPLPTE